jgi:hypothetical protein
MENLDFQKLRNVWSKTLQDEDVQRALSQLKKDGFEISQRIPEKVTFQRPTWAFHIAAIPLLPNRPSRRRVHSHLALRKYRYVVSALRQLAKHINDPFCDVSIMSTTDYPKADISTLQERLDGTADFLEQFISWNWYIRDRNPRNALIAELRWTIRERTGRPHDAELSVLIDAAFRATGIKEGFYIDATTLDRIEKREKEGRVKATRRLRSQVNSSLDQKLGRPTRLRQNPRKRV